MPDVQVNGFTVPNWRHGGTVAKLRLYSSDSWTDFDGIPHLSGITGSPEDCYQEIPCTVSGTTVTVPDFTTPPTINSPDYRNVRITGILVDEKDTVIEPPLFEEWIIPTYSPITWLKLTVFNSSPNAPLGDRYVTIDALLALLIGEGSGLLHGLIPLLDDDNVFTGDNIFQGDVTAERLITPLVLGGTQPASSLTLRATSGAGVPGSEIHFQVGTNGSIEALTIHSDGSILAPNLTSNVLAARSFALISSVTSNKVTFTADPNSQAYSLQWPVGNALGFLRNDGTGILTWQESSGGTGGGGDIGPTTGTGMIVRQDNPTINTPLINNATLVNPDIGAAHGSSLILQNNAGMQLRLSNGGVNYAEFTEDAGGSLNFYSGGAHFNPQLNIRESLGQPNRKWLGLYAAELWVETLVAQQTMATIGGRILVGPTTTLTADLPAATATTTTITVKHNSMTNGDIVLLEDVGKLEFLRVASGPSGTGPYTYTVLRNLDLTGQNDWLAGDAVFNTGQAGNGFIDLYALAGIKPGSNQAGPTIVGNVRTGSAYNAWSEHWAIGNLQGVYGYSATAYGAAFGKYSPTGAGAPYITIDSLGGAEGGIRILNGQNVKVGQWDTSGNITVGQATALLPNIFLNATTGALQIRNGSGTVRMQFSGDGSGFLANNNLRWDTAGNLFINGSVLVSGSVTASAMRIGNFDNLCENPGFERTPDFTGAGWYYTDLAGVSGPSITTDWSHGGTRCARIQYFAGGSASSQLLNAITCDCYEGNKFYIEGWVAGTGGGGSGGVRVCWYDVNFNLLSTTDFLSSPLGWAKVSGVATAPAGAAYCKPAFVVLNQQNYQWYFDDLFFQRGEVGGWTITQNALSASGVTLNSGVNAGLGFGSSPPTGPSGTGIWLDRTGLYGLFGAAVMVKIDALTGALTATGADISGAINATSGSFTGAVNATSGSITGPLTIGGATGSLAFGNPPPTSAAAGTGIWLDRTGLYGLNAAAGGLQVKLDAVDGSFLAGGGSVKLAANGLTIFPISAYGPNNSIKWMRPGTISILADIYLSFNTTTFIKDFVIWNQNYIDSSSNQYQAWLRIVNSSSSSAAPGSLLSLQNIIGGVTVAGIYLRNSVIELSGNGGISNIGINTTSFGTGASGVIAIANGVAPTTGVNGVGQLFVDNGALKYRGGGGTLTTIANA